MKILLTLVSISLALLGLSSCKSEPSEWDRVEAYLDGVNESAENVREKIEAHFKDTDYQLEVENTVRGSGLQEGVVKSEDLLSFEFVSTIYVDGAETLAKAEKVDQRMRQIFTDEEVDEMEILYILGREGKSKRVASLENMRMSEEFRPKQGLEERGNF